MKDSQIREALKNKIFSRYVDTNTLILEEVNILHGAARIDMMVVNGILHGYELKSDQDNLQRLPEQIKIYSSVFDRVTLVVGYRHAYSALKVIPEWWGVKLAEVGTRGAIHFSDARNPKNNPSLDAISLAQLLWKGEALSLLEEMGEAKGVRSKPRSVIYAKLVKVCTIDFLHTKVVQMFRLRNGLRSDVLLTPSDG